jgi:hypothetical protein
MEPWVEVRRSCSEGAGLGVFAARDFQEGEFIGVYVGQPLLACSELSEHIAALPNRQHPFDAVITLGSFFVDGKQPFMACSTAGASRVPLWVTQPHLAPYPCMFAHLMNSCSWGDPPHTPANVAVWRGDGVVEALVDIRAGQELVWKYKL